MSLIDSPLNPREGFFLFPSAVSSVKWWVGFDEYFEAEQGEKLTILAS
ncbi:MAG: hypothetical protein V3V00_00330 [Saprospiraceae bacterium]